MVRCLGFIILLSSLQLILAEGPHFVGPIQNVSVVVGGTASLSCVVANLGEKSVTWMRSKDFHILSVDDITYSSDSRISPSTTDRLTWSINFVDVQHKDGGKYECVVNTDSQLTSFGYLQVVDPSTTSIPETTTSASSSSAGPNCREDRTNTSCPRDDMHDYRIREAGAAARAAEIEEETARVNVQVAKTKLEVEKITLEAANSGVRAEASRSQAEVARARAEEARALNAEEELQSERERRTKSQLP